MKLACILIVTVIGCNLNQPNIAKSPIAQDPPSIKLNSMDTFQFSFSKAHKNAQKLMKAEYLWSPIEETAPFGNDDGSDAAYGFRLWRNSYKGASPTFYLKDWINSTGYPPFDLKELDTSKIQKYLSTPALKSEVEVLQQIEVMKSALKNTGDTAMNNLSDAQIREMVEETSKDMGISFLIGQDNAIIGISFAQFVLEGNLDTELQTFAIIAIKRQMLPILLNRWDEKYRQRRLHQLKEMLEIIENANN